MTCYQGLDSINLHPLPEKQSLKQKIEVGVGATIEVDVIVDVDVLGAQRAKGVDGDVDGDVSADMGVGVALEVRN